ncbi:MAG: two-component sensor histidine kinase [Saprospiraceae bacterium]|nr:two-component sensor histidine kinase [Saprospiraceae bacterium]
MASPDFTFSGRYLLPYFDHPIFNDAWNSRLNGDEYFSKAFSVEEKNSFFKHAFEHSDYRKFPNEFKEWIFQNDKHSLSFAWSKNSAILLPSHTGVVPNESDIEILKRFVKVFEQAYIRFLDLQVKEEQAAMLFKEKQRLEKALDHLQNTQKQLIQSEKMASLGELTAGIAHEIQNPLNFVNNFSELSNELLVEMNEELAKGDLEEAKAIASDIRQNLEKIYHHGKRADNIVKSMIQHSRNSSATKELTDINKLTDEFFRLAYHGLRAKDKSFNAKLITDYDDKVGSLPIIAQDMGRVILNLITNAFYTVNEKKIQQSKGFNPTVTVTTKKTDDQILIAVEDNGNGIPQPVLEKIFQPFFTTKPTGQGTGLGLSLAFDIVTKGHGGELKVETTAGEGSSFIISIPSQ